MGVDHELLTAADSVDVGPWSAASPASLVAMVAERRRTVGGPEPRRQPPVRAIGCSRCRQRETIASTTEQAAAASVGLGSIDPERPGRDVDGVVGRSRPPMQVRMGR